jgi:hypothetical protein
LIYFFLKWSILKTPCRASWRAAWSGVGSGLEHAPSRASPSLPRDRISRQAEPNKNCIRLCFRIHNPPVPRAPAPTAPCRLPGTSTTNSSGSLPLHPRTPEPNPLDGPRFMPCALCSCPRASRKAPARTTCSAVPPLPPPLAPPSSSAFCSLSNHPSSVPISFGTLPKLSALLRSELSQLKRC